MQRKERNGEEKRVETELEGKVELEEGDDWEGLEGGRRTDVIIEQTGILRNDL